MLHWCVDPHLTARLIIAFFATNLQVVLSSQANLTRGDTGDEALQLSCKQLLRHLDPRAADGEGEVVCETLVGQLMALHGGTPFAELGSTDGASGGGSRRGSGLGGGSRRGSGSSSSSSRRPSGAPLTPVDLPAAEVWAALKEYQATGVALADFDLEDFEQRFLLVGKPNTKLNYATAQRVKLAAERLLGQTLQAEFDGFE